MAGTLKFDLDWAVDFDAGRSGNSWRRSFVIEGLEAASIPDLIDEAFVLIPDIGTPTPTPVDGMFVRSSRIDRFAPDVGNPGPPQLHLGWGSVTYTTPTRSGGALTLPDDDGPGVIISSTSSVEEIETNRDANDVEITTTFDNVTMSHNVRTFGTARSFQFERLEDSSPRARQDAHEGTLNNAVWNGYATGTVLCQTIDWSTDDQGASYVVTYTFAVRPSWNTTAIHEDPYWPGRPLPGATGLAIYVAQTQPLSDFGALSITLPA